MSAQDCGENCVGLKQKEAVLGVYRCKCDGLRSAVNVSRCGHNVTGALLGCRFHNPKVGSSSLPPATNKINGLQSISFFTITRVPDFCQTLKPSPRLFQSKSGKEG